MMHDLITAQDGTQHRHVCQRCGARKTTRTELWFGECKVKLPPCIHLGAATGEAVICDSCNGTVQIKTYRCAVFGVCLPNTNRAKVTQPAAHCCDGCLSRQS